MTETIFQRWAVGGWDVFLLVALFLLVRFWKPGKRGGDLAARVKELEGQIAGEPANADYRLRWVEIQVDRDIWVQCCEKHCPDAPWFVAIRKAGSG